ncbi:uncharacterized protein LOC105846793 [Hydra vulgaris]|uniref:uncharacterized protein LOC105846793 n=1 Tax=Hydra vulgaris TaxID=6087 RepID=UPI001F5EBE4D|nr:uncharacterized protein LOC105846793 isoform X2 [Hydra vulgaris]
MKSKRSKKGEVIEYVVEYVENASQNEPTKEISNSCINDNKQKETQSNSKLVIDDTTSSSSLICSNINLKSIDNNTQEETQSNSKLVIDDTASNSSLVCSNINLKSIDNNTQEETQSNSKLVVDDATSSISLICSNINLKSIDNNDANSDDLFKSKNFVTKNRGELPEVTASIGFEAENKKVRRSSSIKNFFSRRPNSEVFDKSDSQGKKCDKPKKHRSFSLKKRLSFGKKSRSSKLSSSSTSQDKISKSQEIFSTNQNVVLNTDVDNWRMDGFLFNTMEKKNSMQTLSLLSPCEKEEKMSNSNELIKETKNQVEVLIENEVCNEEKLITKEEYKLIINVEDSLVVTIQNLDIVLNEKHISMPTNYPYDDWLFLEICP